MNELSIVICTRNRSFLLPKLIAAIDDAVVIPDTKALEVLIVDNNSTDDTRSTVESLMQIKRRYKLNYVREKNPGLAHARNKGIQTAGNDMIGFIDDDILPHSEYLQHIVSAMRSNPSVKCFTNRIILHHLDKPAWLETEGRYATIDRGGYDLFHTKFLASNDATPIGASMFFHKSVFDRFGGFDPDFGYDFSRKDMYVPGEESLLYEKIRKELRVLYVHEAVVYHTPIGQKYDKTFICRFYKGIGFWYGSAEARNPQQKIIKTFAGFPASYYKRLIATGFNFIFSRFSSSKTVQYYHLFKWKETLGYFKGYSAFRKRRDR